MSSILLENGFEVIDGLGDRGRGHTTHISILSPKEQNVVAASVAIDVKKRWNFKKIAFEVIGVNFWYHYSRKYDKRKIVCALEITCPDILKIREELGFPEVEVQVADVTVEAEVNVDDQKPNVVDVEVGGFSCHMTVAQKLHN